jgi:hypothetical protein
MALYYDPQTKKAVGVCCDVCNAIKTTKFEYFNVKIDLVEVDATIGKTGIKNIDRQYLDLDMCEACIERLKTAVKKAIEKREKNGNWTTTTTPTQAAQVAPTNIIPIKEVPR